MTRVTGITVPFARPRHVWESIGIDFVSPLPVTRAGHDAILVVIDRASKTGHFIPTTTRVSGEEVWKLLYHNVVRLHGLPLSIVSDRDPRFTGHFWTQLQAALRVALNMSAAYHPASDGQVERLNRILEDYLRAFVAHSQCNACDASHSAYTWLPR